MSFKFYSLKQDEVSTFMTEAQLRAILTYIRLGQADLVNTKNICEAGHLLECLMNGQTVVFAAEPKEEIPF